MFKRSMFSNRRSSTRDSSRSTKGLQATIDRAGYSHVVFSNNGQRIRFTELMKRPMEATRFIDIPTLKALGLKKEMKSLLKKSGCSGLYTMCEHSYRCITLEFLSSYHYDEDEQTIAFRLFNTDNSLSLKEWGKIIGCRYHGYTSTTQPREGIDMLWKLLTGLDREEGAAWKFRAHFIHHPVLRLWCRLVVNAFFGRPEPTNLKSMEIHMLFSTLNADGGPPFQVCVADFLAKHLQLVAEGTINPILIGGLVTHIAKSLFDNVDEGKLQLVPGAPNGDVLTMNLTNLTRMLYIKATNDGKWWWKLRGEQILILPEQGDHRRLNPVTTLSTDHIDWSYYLLDDPTDRHGSPPIGGDDGSEASGFQQPGIPTIDPEGDYSRFAHYPFEQESYRPAGFDPFKFPPTFATYPPFAQPQVWNQNTRDSMLTGLCNQVQQFHFHQSLHSHNVIAALEQEGRFPPNTVHPPFYQSMIPPGTPPLEGSYHDDGGNGSYNGDGGDVSYHGSGSYRGEGSHQYDEPEYVPGTQFNQGTQSEDGCAAAIQAYLAADPPMRSTDRYGSFSDDASCSNPAASDYSMPYRSPRP